MFFEHLHSSDNPHVISRNDITKIENDNLLKKHTSNCFVQSGGAAYISTNLLEAKPNQKRQFAQVTARRIVESLTGTEIEQDCMCQQALYFGKSRCKIVGRREKEQLAVGFRFSHQEKNYVKNIIEKL